MTPPPPFRTRPARIAYVLPTRNRPDRLARTLESLGALPRHDATLHVVDNASDQPPRLPHRLDNGIDVDLICRSANEGAAARNAGAAAADRACDWIVMLDDDSHPMSLAFLDVLRDAPSDLGALAAEIFLPRTGTREAGGLPEVFIGCGVAIRREAFLDAGGYDPTFHYYAEEYDLSARFIRNGLRVELDRRFRVAHHKDSAGRNMSLILRRLVRNNAWVARRYSPPERLHTDLRETVCRYARIAQLERAFGGYATGLGELLLSYHRQARTPLSRAQHERFTGLAVARDSVRRHMAVEPFSTCALFARGKNAGLIELALADAGVRVVSNPAAADARMIGTLSPGPLLDAWEREIDAPDRGRLPRLLSPWTALTSPSAAPAALCAA